MTITYPVRNGVYVNMTNRCPCACTFCLRQHGPSVYGSDPLWLEREPTVEEVEQALAAQADGADYLGVGAVFPTTTKTNTRKVTPEIIRGIRQAVTIPFVVIGGVNAENITRLYGLGIDGAAVISAVIAQPDITAAARKMRAAAELL